MILLIIYMAINIWHRSYTISNIRDSQVDFQLKVVVATKPDDPFGFIIFRLTNTNYSTLGAVQALLKFFPYFLGEEMAAICIWQSEMKDNPAQFQRLFLCSCSFSSRTEVSRLWSSKLLL